MTPARFRSIIAELLEENPLAVRPLLRILEIRFTDEVKTLAVTCESRPSLLVNLRFVGENCRTDAHVKAVILHEFLHVVLRHTDSIKPSTDAEHLAMDAVINAIIHRSCGVEYSSMMSKYYADVKGAMKLLRPRLEADYDDPEFKSTWAGLYVGALVVDDIREVIESVSGFRPGGLRGVRDRLIGGHGDGAEEIAQEVRDALDDALRAMNGDGIWRAPHGRGVAAAMGDAQFIAGRERIDRWMQRTLSVLQRHVLADPASSLKTERASASYLPVLSPADRRAFVRSLWSPFIPDAIWETSRRVPGGTTQVYLDVSGSMNAEMPAVIALLARLRRHIRTPFWAFSNAVAPATIRNGALVTRTTGGTSIECVLAHVARTKPKAAVVVTDGYIEPVRREWLAAVAQTRLHAVVTRDGSTKLLDGAGIPATQLERFPA